MNQQEIEATLADHGSRIAKLEAAQRAPLTAANHPMGGANWTPSKTAEPAPEEDFLAAFGRVFGDGGRLLTKFEQNAWNRQKKSWGGSIEIPESDAVEALLAHYELEGKPLRPEGIMYAGKPALVFKAPGLGYGTPNCFVIGIAKIELSYGERKMLNGLIALIEAEKAERL